MLRELESYLEDYPDDAQSWAQATDEIRDLAREAKECYNSFAEEAVFALDFRSFSTPAEWNREGKKYIISVYKKMSPEAKREFNKYLIEYLE